MTATGERPVRLSARFYDRMRDPRALAAAPLGNEAVYLEVTPHVP